MVIVLFVVSQARAQAEAYTLAVRDVPLAEALERFSTTTGFNITYYSDLVEGRRATCALEAAPPDALLRCVLAGTGLDFFRLSTGTYVVTEAASQPPQAGVLRGLVVDASTGAPLPGAHVMLAGAGVGTSTNDAGLFVFPPMPPGTYRTQTTYLGYRASQRRVDVPSGATADVELALTPDPVRMEPLVVDGVQQRRVADQLGAATMEEPVLLKAAALPGATDVLASVNLLSGVQLSEATSSVHVQEGAAGEHQLRLDGMPLFLPTHLAGLFGPFSPLAIERLTVHKAGFGASLGSQTSGLVLAEHRLRPLSGSRLDVMAEPLSLNALANVGTTLGERRALHVMAAGRSSLWNETFSPTYQDLLREWSAPDLFLVDAPASLLDPQPPLQREADVRAFVEPHLDFSDVHAAAELRLGALSRLHASAYRGRRSLSSESVPPPDSVDHPTLTDAYAWTNDAAQIRYETVLGTRTLQSIALRTSRYRLDHDYTLIDRLTFYRYVNRAPVRVLAETPVDDGNRIREASLTYRAEHALSQRHYLEAGAEATHIDSRFSVVSVNGLAVLDEALKPDTIVVDGFLADSLVARRQAVAQRYAAWHLAGYLGDRITLSDHVTLELGGRLTWLPHRDRWYAEPRAALRYDGRVAVRLAAGLYRQYLGQYDVSSSNLGALLPRLRFWVPIDSTTAPPKAYHLAGDLAWFVRPTASVRLEAYAKRYARTLSVRTSDPQYVPIVIPVPSVDSLATQDAYLEAGDGYAAGLALTVETVAGSWRVEARGAWNHARRRTPLRFGGTYVPLAWTEPWAVHLRVGYRPAVPVLLSAHWQAAWGRAAAFRDVYYDYLAADEQTRFFGGYDLADPAAHRLAPLYRLDLGASYHPRLGPLRLVLRAEVVNALDRRNVAEWRLERVPDENVFRRTERTLLPRTAVVSVRASW